MSNAIFNELDVESIIKIANEKHQLNQLNEAESIYKQILQVQPNNAEVLYSLGIVTQQKGKLREAEQMLNAASHIQSDSARIWFALGNLRLTQEQYPEAVIAYRQALALRPDSLPIYNNLGYALQQQGLFHEAVNWYQKALEIKPDFTEAEANLGNALYAQGKLLAKEKLHYAQLNHQLGVARKKAGDLNVAVTYYRSSIALQPDLLEAHYELGVALQEQGNWHSAVTCYQKVAELNSNDSEVYFKLAKAYQQEKQFEKAGEFYKQGLKLINPRYARAVLDEKNSDVGFCITRPIPQTEVTVGTYQFPGIPPVSDELARPFWSVVVTVYNRTDYILEALASVLAQWPGEEEMEILVMDNASEIPMLEIINSIGQGVVKYYRNPENVGAINNMNAGIALSRGHWIHILHDDDAVLPGFYAQLQHSLNNCTAEVGAAFTGFEYINDKGETLYYQDCGYGEQKRIAENWLQNIGVMCLVMLPAVVIRRTTFERLGGYSPEVKEVADWEMNKRIAAFYDWWYEAGMLARYRQHSQRESDKYWQSWRQPAAFRRAIEMSESYLPIKHCGEITAKARNHYFNACLANVNHPLKQGDIGTAFRVIQETLKLDSSKQATATLFAWLTQDEVVALREEVVSKLLSIPVDNTVKSLN